MFQKITDVVCNQLEDIIRQEGGCKDEDDQEEYITAKDFMTNFATDEFLLKNIRVRPVSGSGKENDERQSEHVSRNANASGAGGGGFNEITDDEDKYNKMMHLEMEDQRKKIKTQKEEVERKRLVEAEKAAKAAKKK